MTNFQKKIWVCYHPGEHLLDELQARKISQTKFAELTNLTIAEINDIIKWRRNITPRIAWRFQAALHVSAGFWLWLQNDRDIYCLSKNEDEQKICREIEKKSLAYN